jgi:hypothetical protein
VIEAGAAKRFIHRLGNARTDADRQGRGDFAFRPADAFADAVGDGMALRPFWIQAEIRAGNDRFGCSM